MFVVLTALRHVRELASRLRRLAVLTLGGVLPDQDDSDGRPRHWVEYVRKRAPHLLERGAMPAIDARTQRPSMAPPPELRWDGHTPRPYEHAHGRDQTPYDKLKPHPTAEKMSYADVRRRFDGTRPDYPPPPPASRSEVDWPASAGPRRLAWSWTGGARKARRSQPLDQGDVPQRGASISPEYDHPRVRTVGRGADEVALSGSPSTARFLDWSSAALLPLDATRSWPSAELAHGERPNAVFESPAAPPINAPPDDGYARPYYPWPSLPEPERENFEEQAARSCAEAERRLRREQRRL